MSHTPEGMPILTATPHGETLTSLARRLLAGAGTAMIRLARTPTCEANIPTLHGHTADGSTWIALDPTSLRDWSPSDLLGSVPVVMSVTQQAPYPDHVITTSAALIRGQLEPLPPGTVPQTCPPAQPELDDMNSHWPGMNFFLLNPESIWARDLFDAADLEVDEVMESGIDPLAACGEDATRLLCATHMEELSVIAERCLEHNGSELAILPVSTDSYGVTLLCPRMTPPKVVRIPFHAPVQTLSEAVARIDHLAWCVRRGHGSCPYLDE